VQKQKTMYHYYNDFFELGQQRIHYNLYQIGVPSDDPVHVVKRIMMALDFTCLLQQYSRLGRKGYNPIMLFAILVYAALRGVRSVDRIVELCARDIGFIWLAQGERPQRDAFYDFINNKLSHGILKELHYQFMRRLQKEGLISLEALFIDGTKIEANANRYTFVWRGTLNYHLVGLLDAIENGYNEYNAFITENAYDVKYTLFPMNMFVIEGMEKVREVIQKNRSRKINNKKKLSNNALIEIDNMSPLEMLKLQAQLKVIAKGESIVFVDGKGQRKSELQKLYERFEAFGERLMRYKESFEIMGSDRNSYSKTDLEATFMRMKDDHMMNGQLKPAYNVQIAVENYFVVHSYVSVDRTDYSPLIPVLEMHQENLGFYPKEVTADSGYSSEKNLLFLQEKGIESYIKLQEHELMKTRAYKAAIGKYRNMTKVDAGYLCANQRLITFDKSEVSFSKGYKQTHNVYSCKDCSNCDLKPKCLYKYDDKKHQNKTKVIKVNESWDSLKDMSHKNVQSDKGILNRQIRSIQTEGFFGDIKANDGFRQFNHRSKEKVIKEFMLFAFGKNIDKYYKFITGKIKRFEGKTEEAA
jgi:transposase